MGNVTTTSTCTASLCVFRNSLGYCTLTDGCILTKKTVEAPIQKEEKPLAETITPDIIRKEFMGLVNDLCLWDTPEDESGNEFKTRSLFYIQGAYDMAAGLIHRLGEGVCNYEHHI